MANLPVLGFLEGPELIIVLVVILVLFGGAKLPQLARSIGQAQKEFKKGLADDDDDKPSSSDLTSNKTDSSSTDASNTDKT